MTDKVLIDLLVIQLNIDTELKVWFTFAVDMAKSVDVEPSLPRTANLGAAVVITYQERTAKRTTDVLLQFQ